MKCRSCNAYEQFSIFCFLITAEWFWFLFSFVNWNAVGFFFLVSRLFWIRTKNKRICICNAVNKSWNRVYNCKINWDLHHNFVWVCSCFACEGQSLHFVCFISIRLLSDFTITFYGAQMLAGLFISLRRTLCMDCITCEVYDIQATICGPKSHHWQSGALPAAFFSMHKEHKSFIFLTKYTIYLFSIHTGRIAAPCNK